MTTLCSCSLFKNGWRQSYEVTRCPFCRPIAVGLPVGLWCCGRGAFSRGSWRHECGAAGRSHLFFLGGT